MDPVSTLTPEASSSWPVMPVFTGPGTSSLTAIFEARYSIDNVSTTDATAAFEAP